MIYRILKAPPGYAPEEQYYVAAYETTDYDSYKFEIKNDHGSKFVATQEEARRLIPINAKSLPFEPKNQFLELWAE